MTRAQLKALPPGFRAMILCVLLVGCWAGIRVLPVLAVTSPALALLLARAGVRANQERLLAAEARLEDLPADARAAVAGALARLQSPEPRAALIGLSRIGAQACRNLPAEYRDRDYGHHIASLVIAAAETVTHVESYTNTLEQLEAQRQSMGPDAGLDDVVTKVRAERDARVQQLATAMRVLSEIGPDVATAGDRGTANILALLDDLKREVQEHEAAEREIQALLAATS